MKTSRGNDKKRSETKLAEMRGIWPLSTMLELSQRILNKGVIRGNKVVFSDEHRKKLLSYSTRIEPILAKIKETQGAKAEPLERVVNAWREKMNCLSVRTGTRP